MTVHILTLDGDRQSGKTMLALQMLEYAQLAGQSVAYCGATEQQAQWLKKSTETSVPCLNPRSQDWLVRRFSMVVVDNYSQFHAVDRMDFLQELQFGMAIHPFAQIILID
jgi:archaellum biogenesis ATPase FlaH